MSRAETRDDSATRAESSTKGASFLALRNNEFEEARNLSLLFFT